MKVKDIVDLDENWQANIPCQTCIGVQKLVFLIQPIVRST